MVCVPEWLKPRELTGLDLYRKKPFAEAIVSLHRDYARSVYDAEAVRLSLDVYVADGVFRDDQVDDLFQIIVGGLPVEIRSDRMPFELYIMDGPIGEMCGWMVSNMNRHQPEFALLASIQAMAVVLSRRVRSETGDGTNIYQLLIGLSASGKDGPFKAVSTVLVHSGGSALVGTGSLTGPTAALTQMTDSPAIFFPIDEAGKTIGAHKSNRADPYSSELITLLLKAYSSAWDPKFRHKGMSDKTNNIEISCPHINFLGVGTPETTYGKVIDVESLADGFTSRIVSFDTGDHVPPLVQVQKTDPPKELCDKLRTWIDFTPSGDTGWVLSPAPKIVSLSEAAKRSFQAAIVRWDLMADHLAGESGSSIYRRCAEHARKYALIYACSEKTPDDEITIEQRHADWGIALISWLTDRLITTVKTKVMASQRELDIARTGDFLRKRLTQVKEVYTTEINRTFREWSAKYRGELLDDLVDSGEFLRQPKMTKGRPSLAYSLPPSVE